MKYLLDTHIFLWCLNGDKRLQAEDEEIIVDKTNFIFVSVISAWEISIKLKTDTRFRLRTSIKKAFEISGFEILNISFKHVLCLDRLPMYHKDPFDRMLIAQAQVENCKLITVDPKIKKYKN